MGNECEMIIAFGNLIWCYFFHITGFLKSELLNWWVKTNKWVTGIPFVGRTVCGKKKKQSSSI